MKTLHTIQAYRGLAALLVLLHHTNFIMGKYSLNTALTECFRFGHAGVEFFFVLSGFILYRTYLSNEDNSKDVKSFLINRFIRIYPLYWTITLVLLPLWIFRPSYGEAYHSEISSIFTSLFLIPSAHAPHIIVAWSLTHEVMFYLLFVILILNRKSGLMLMALILTLTLFFNLLTADPEFPEVFYLSNYNALFVFGIFTGLAIDRIDLSKPFNEMVLISLFVIGNLIFVFSGTLENIYGMEGKFLFAYGASSVMIVAGCCSPRINSAFERFNPLMQLGAASYSIYLVHIFIIEFLCKRLNLSFLSLLKNNDFKFLILVFSGLLSGIIIHLTYEKRLSVLLKAKFLCGIKKAGRQLKSDRICFEKSVISVSKRETLN